MDALVTEYLDWHARPLLGRSRDLGALVGIVRRRDPHGTLRTGGRLDLVAALGLAVGPTGVLLAISKGAQWGWNAPIILLLVPSDAGFQSALVCGLLAAAACVIIAALIPKPTPHPAEVPSLPEGVL
ncbi:hypothetical protein [Microbacterium sp. P5_E9]